MVKPPEPPIVTQADLARIAASIREASELGKRLKQCGLSRRAILVLLHDCTGCAQRDIKLILDALPELAKFYAT